MSDDTALARALGDAERHSAEVHRLVAQIRELNSHIRDLNEQIAEAKRHAEAARKLANDRGDRLRAYGVEFDHLKAELEEARKPKQEPPYHADLPDLPDGLFRAATAALDAFMEGYAEYGPGAADALGLAGQWGDLHRKVMKLKRFMWSGDGHPAYLTRETPQEILRDIFGHCLLALEMIERGFEGGR